MTKIKLNASALKVSSCSRRLYWTVIDGYRAKVFNNDIEFGTAFHRFASNVELDSSPAGFAKALIDAQEYYRNTPMIVKSKKKYMTEFYLAKVCTDWYNKMRATDAATILRSDDGHPLVEIPFEVPFYNSDNLEITICGTIDKIVKFKNGCIAIGDYKTTSSWDQKEYFESYYLSVQMRLYLWAFLRVCQSAPQDSMLSKIVNPRSVGIFIDGIFLNGESSQDYVRSNVFFFNDNQMIEFEELLSEYPGRFTRMLVNNATTVDYMPPADGILNDSCTTKYGKCQFFGCCSAPNPKITQALLKQEFKQEPYDPLKER